MRKPLGDLGRFADQRSRGYVFQTGVGDGVQVRHV